MSKKLISRIIPCLGFLLLILYISRATVDVVYSDYIRTINAYGGDFFNLASYFQPDFMDRVLILYPFRVINTALFGYSTTFDMILGAVFLALCAWTAGKYAFSHGVKALPVISMMIVVFSLDKWEMITNGTGWVIFLAMFCFYENFILYDRVRTGNAGKSKETVVMFMPLFVSMFIAGAYCTVYCAALLVIYVIDYYMIIRSDDLTPEVKKSRRNTQVKRIVLVIIPIIMYLITMKLSTYEYAESSDMGFIQSIFAYPIDFIKFCINSFAGLVMTGESYTEYAIPGIVRYIVGLISIVAYAGAVYLNFKTGLYKKTAVPMLLIALAIMGHGSIIVSRWRFLEPMYTLSSRYAVQYMSGTLGIMLTFFMTGKSNRVKYAFVILILIGQILSTVREIRIAPYRHEAFVRMQSVAVNYQNETDDTIKSVLQYRDPQLTRQALKLLEDKKRNVFR